MASMTETPASPRFILVHNGRFFFKIDGSKKVAELMDKRHPVQIFVSRPFDEGVSVAIGGYAVDLGFTADLAGKAQNEIAFPPFHPLIETPEETGEGGFGVV